MKIRDITTEDQNAILLHRAIARTQTKSTGFMKMVFKFGKARNLKCVDGDWKVYQFFGLIYT